MGAAEEDTNGHRVAFVAGILGAALDLSDTMVFPFLADFCMAHGVSQSSVGLIFACLAVGIGMTAPCMGRISAYMGGPSRVLVVGALLFCVGRVLTGLLPVLVPDGLLMLVSSCAIFLVTGCAYALSEMGALSWVLSTAPSGQKVGALAILVSSRSTGMMLGPPLGGGLFDLIGWAPGHQD